VEFDKRFDCKDCGCDLDDHIEYDDDERGGVVACPPAADIPASVIARIHPDFVCIPTAGEPPPTWPSIIERAKDRVFEDRARRGNKDAPR
jgi:hypothetical protein